jgi:hypothetical protein
MWAGPSTQARGGGWGGECGGGPVWSRLILRRGRCSRQGQFPQSFDKLLLARHRAAQPQPRSFNGTLPPETMRRSVERAGFSVREPERELGCHRAWREGSLSKARRPVRGAARYDLASQYQPGPGRFRMMRYSRVLAMTGSGRVSPCRPRRDGSWMEFEAAKSAICVGKDSCAAKGKSAWRARRPRSRRADRQHARRDSPYCSGRHVEKHPRTASSLLGLAPPWRGFSSLIEIDDACRRSSHSAREFG